VGLPTAAAAATGIVGVAARGGRVRGASRAARRAGDAAILVEDGLERPGRVRDRVLVAIARPRYSRGVRSVNLLWLAGLLLPCSDVPRRAVEEAEHPPPVLAARLVLAPGEPAQAALDGLRIRRDLDAVAGAVDQLAASGSQPPRSFPHRSTYSAHERPAGGRSLGVMAREHIAAPAGRPCCVDAPRWEAARRRSSFQGVNLEEYAGPPGMEGDLSD